MMTTSPDTQITGTPIGVRSFPRIRLLVAFTMGLVLVAVVAAGTLLAYEQAYAGKVGAGISVGGVELAGLTRTEAAAKLTEAFASVGQGTLTLKAETGDVHVSYAELGRRPDIEAMLGAAFAVGRTGDPLARVVDEARAAVARVDVPPQITIDQSVLAARLSLIAASIDRDPSPAAVTRTTEGFAETPAVWGRHVDQTSTASAINAAISAADAPQDLALPLEVESIQPAVTDTDAMIARSRAGRMTHDIALTHGKEQWLIPASPVRSWLSFGLWADGSYGPLVDPVAVQASIKKLSTKIASKPINATFLVGKGGQIVGVKAAHNGRRLDVPGTALAVQNLLVSRAAAGNDVASLAPAISMIQPELTTAEASKAAPLMRAISSWTTYYISGPHNGFGANISLPAMAIDGTVLAPGEWFSFWKVVGEVSLAKGYKLGGAIIDGHSVEGTSIGGGICSTSTTMFNAALRAGLQMGIRKNHYYYISRYPKGLDATVFKTDGGGTQDMTFRNDTKYPILIRAYAVPGIVRFTLYSVPLHRHVTLTRPIVKNYKPGHTETQYTTTLAPGVRKQVEYQADGQDVWVTRIVKDASGATIHQETYYSHYAQMTGLILIGASSTTTSSP